MTEKPAEKKKPEEKAKSPPDPEQVNLSTLVERTSERIVFLKKQQEELQKQKAELEVLNQQRKELDRGKREILTNLERAIAVLDDEENDFQRKHSLVRTTKEEFKRMLREVRGVREESWQAENIKEEISHALALVGRAKMNYRDAQGKIEALTSRELERGTEVRLSQEGSAGIWPARPAEILKRGFLFFFPAALLALLVILLIRLISLL